MIRVYTTGVFDILHRGHFNVLTKARAHGDKLIVGVQDDLSVLRSKGRLPTLSVKERVYQLRALPFVDDVIVYKGVNQIPLFKKLRPHVVVQGDDWIRTADRTAMIRYLRAHRIRLILIPYTEGMSTTEVKHRILDNAERRDREFILKHVELLRISDLNIYELFDEAKAAALSEKMKVEGLFVDPITVARFGKYRIVIDGVNRLEALRRLGGKYITSLVVKYEDVDLRANVHWINDGKVTRLSEFGKGTGNRVTFPRLSPAQIIEMIDKGEKVQNGVTWHKVPCAVIRLRVPLSLLSRRFDIKRLLKTKLDEDHIRYYPANVYVCDEWEAV